MARLQRWVYWAVSVWAISLHCCSCAFGQASEPPENGLVRNMSIDAARNIVQDMGAYARLLPDNNGYPVVSDHCCEWTSDWLGRRVVKAEATYPIAAVVLTPSKIKMHFSNVGKVIEFPLNLLHPTSTCTSGYCLVSLGVRNIELSLPPDANAAIRLVGALLKLNQVVLTGGSLQDDARFAETVQTYREATTKPPLPEDARRFKVQAEGAIRDKDFDAATAMYERALDRAPWWPEGHFNRAIVLGETGEFPDAIFEMKRYLALVPEAPNARAAQDKIYDWERQAQRK